MKQEGNKGLFNDPKEKHIFLGNCNYLKTMSKQNSYFFYLASSNVRISILSICLSFNLPFHLSVFLYISLPISFSLLLFQKHFLSPLLVQRSEGDPIASGGRCCFSTTVSATKLGPDPDTVPQLDLSSDHRLPPNSQILSLKERKGEKSWPALPPCWWKHTWGPSGRHSP